VTSDKLPLGGRIARYRERHPDASVSTIAGALCAPPAEVAEVLNDDPPAAEESPADDGDRPDPRFGSWQSADFAELQPETWPAELLEREQWMGHVEKKPFAPWGTQDPPVECSTDDCPADRADDDACDCDGRYKWGYTGHYVDGETIAMAEVDPRLDGRAFLQQEDDPYIYVDGDDVRDPETSAVHPAFVAILEHFGLTYADVSQSGAGVHAIYRGDLPDDVKQASWQLDSKPWGSNDELPSIEVYPGKRVCVMTGDHVPGTPTTVKRLQEDTLDPLLEANDQYPSSHQQREQTEVSTDRADYSFEDHDPEATSADETTDDIRDLFAAIDRLDAQRVAEQTIVHAWNDSASTSEGERAFVPTWGPNSNGTANIVNSQRWQDTGDRGGYGGPVAMAAIDCSDVNVDERVRGGVTGADWFRAVQHLRDLGFDIPRLGTDDVADEDLPPLLEDALDQDDDVDAEPTSTLPLKQLDALPPAARRRAARKRGLDWPNTDDARERLFDTIKEIIANEDHRIVDAPTSLGKSFTSAATRWAVHDEATGERPVVHLLETRDARDEAVEAANEHGGSFMVLRSRHEACPVAAGDHDPREVHECDDEDRQLVTVDGEPASHVIDRLCEGKGIPFSVAHQFVENHNDQGVDMPCETDGHCEAIAQWDRYRDGPTDDGLDYWPLVIATHNFAYAPGLRQANNVIVDEQPDYRQDLTTDRIRRAVTAYLQEIDAPVSTWEALVSLSQHEGYADDAAAERDALEDALWAEPDREWYLENEDAHVLAPALARAVFRARDRGNGRRHGKTQYEPPRLEAQAHDDDTWNREWVSVVLDEDNEVRMCRVVPDFGAARSVVGLDAHPSEPVWQVNTVPWITTQAVLDSEERQLWRRYERGLRVVQVGEATRPLSGDRAEEWLDEDRLRTLLGHLEREYGADFRTAITTAQVDDDLEALMHEAGIPSPELMHYGDEKSRNDFAGESIGLVNGCMDPGDGYVLDLLAELDLDAECPMVDCPHCDGTGECSGHCETDSCHSDSDRCVKCNGDGEYRERNRTFEGPNASSAEAILASVRENHVAQAAGRYARDPDDPERTATVFVRTDAAPERFVDLQVPGVEWTYTNLQRDIVDELRSATGARTTREIADAVGCSKEHVRQTLSRLVEDDVVQAIAEEGANGATLYSDDGLPTRGVVDVDEPPTTAYEDTSRWSLAIRDRTINDQPDNPGGDDSTSEVWDWQSATDGGGSPE